MKVSMLAPPWIPVPAPAYGGIGRLDEIEPAACRDACERRFGVPAVVRGYEEVYRAAMSVRAQSGS